MGMELGLLVDWRGAVEGVVAVVGEMLSRDMVLSGLLGRRQRYRAQAILLSMNSSVHGGLHIRVGVVVSYPRSTDGRVGGTGLREERR